LSLFGLPLAEDMPGRVLDEVLEGGTQSARSPRFIATYQTELNSGALRPTGSRVDAEIEDRLRALGYIQ
jgi:hypothetical protein